MKKETEIQKARATSGTSCASTGFLSVKLKYEKNTILVKPQCFDRDKCRNADMLLSLLIGLI